MGRFEHPLKQWLEPVLLVNQYYERHNPALSLRAKRSNLGDAEGLAKRRRNDSRETAEKEVQNTSCRGSGSAPPAFKKSPKIGGLGG